jgi:ATP-dependent DNA helicase RecG
MGLADGSIDILVGTHAIFQQAVGYKRLGLAVVDEQHRFGVAQRMMLAQKAERPPHLLVMTATPIPHADPYLYGEMDVSRLDEMPPGRQPIETRVLSASAAECGALGAHRGGGRPIGSALARKRSLGPGRGGGRRKCLGCASATIGLVHGR